MKYLTKLMQRFGMTAQTPPAPPAEQPPVADAVPNAVETPSIDGD